MIKDPSLRALLDVVEDWRIPGLRALDNPVIASHIGEKNARQMARLARRAGHLLIGNDSSHVIQSRNGLFFMPVPEDVPARATTVFTKGKRQEVIPIGWIAASGNPKHASFQDMPNTSIICLPGNPDFSDEERAAAFAHEMTHELQFRKNGEEDDTLPYRACIEAQAYDTQFKVSDYYWGGRLSRVVDLNSNPSSFSEIDTGGTGMASHLKSSPILLNALGAVVRNRVHGYVPDGITLPSAELTEEYLQLGLLRSHPDANLE